MATLGAIIAPEKFKPQSAVTVTSEVTVWTPANGKRFRLIGWDLVCTADGSLTFKDNTAGATIYICPVQAGVPVRMTIGMIGIQSAAANNVLTITGPTGTITGTIFGTEE
jgi:hypothetical protein